MPSAGDLVKKIKTMKTLPNIAVRLTRMIHDDASSLQEFEEVIRLDPTLVLRLLKLVNSPYYALANKVESIAEAVAFIGMDSLRNLIVMDIFKHIITLKAEEGGFSRVMLWRHSAAVGVACQMISERIFAVKGENAFLGGLIHDIGLIIEDQVVPDLFAQAYLACQEGQGHITIHEDRIIGTDHAKVGSAIARDWNLPQEINKAIADHHADRPDILPGNLTGVIQVAEYLVDRMNLTPFKGMVKQLPQRLLGHMYQQIHEYKSVAADLPEIIEKADEVFGLE